MLQVDLKTNNAARRVINGAATLRDAAQALYMGTVRVANAIFGTPGGMDEVMLHLSSLDPLDETSALFNTNLPRRASHHSDTVFSTVPLGPTLFAKQVSRPVQSNRSMTKIFTASASYLGDLDVCGLLEGQLGNNSDALRQAWFV